MWVGVVRGRLFVHSCLEKKRRYLPDHKHVISSYLLNPINRLEAHYRRDPELFLHILTLPIRIRYSFTPSLGDRVFRVVHIKNMCLCFNHAAGAH